MTPGAELDAAVLRILGYEFHRANYGVPCYPAAWYCDGKETDYRGQPFSTDPNGHEALRLCGPWLDERCWSWGVCKRHGLINAWAWSHGTGRGTDGNYDTRAEAIARLVLAIAEREGT